MYCKHEYFYDQIYFVAFNFKVTNYIDVLLFSMINTAYTTRRKLEALLQHINTNTPKRYHFQSQCIIANKIVYRS